MGRIMTGQSAGYPGTEWFNIPVINLAPVAPTPGTPDAAAMAYYGAINIPRASSLSAIHLHQIADGSGGTNTLEVYRKRSGVWTKIADASLVFGGGEFGFTNFTFVSPALRRLVRGDYLYLQATSLMSGSDRGFVDVHFDKATL